VLEQRALDLSVATYLKRKKATEASPMLLVTEAGSYLRLIDFCVTQLKAQGPSRTCNESKEKEEEGEASPMLLEGDRGFLQSTHPPGCERRPNAPHTTSPNGYISNCRGRRDYGKSLTHALDHALLYRLVFGVWVGTLMGS